MECVRGEVRLVRAVVVAPPAAEALDDVVMVRGCEGEEVYAVEPEGWEVEEGVDLA